jgi:hypothetical protein
MVYQKKIQKWAASVGLPDDFWVNGDSAPLKEFLSKLLSSEILRTAPDIVVAETIPFEKVIVLYNCFKFFDLIKGNFKSKLS